MYILIILVIIFVEIVFFVRYFRRNKSGVSLDAAARQAAVTSWSTWDDSVHMSTDQAWRMNRAMAPNIRVLSFKDGVFDVLGTSGQVYKTTFSDCTCEDFCRRGLPCKHMYRIAIDNHLIDPKPFLKKINRNPEPADKPLVKPEVIRAKKNEITCEFYSVTGKNPETNHMKTVKVVAAAGSPAEKVQKKSGLLPPYEINAEPIYPPTENQISYAQKVGIIFPDDASKSDASLFLDRFEKGKPLAPSSAPKKYITYLIDKNIYVPAYACMEDVSELYYIYISDFERTAFFCMRVWCDIYNQRCLFLEDAAQSERNMFYTFAEHHSEDKVFLRSLSHYSAELLPLNKCLPLKKLKAYEIAEEYLRANCIEE